MPGVGNRLVRIACAAVVALIAGLVFVFGNAPQPSFTVEHFRVPARGYSLAMTVVRPRGNGPFGVVVLNHGVGATLEERRAETPAYLMSTALAFAERGYAVVMPLRRGFGDTYGEFAENAGACTHPDFRRGERAAATDVLAAYDFARTLPYADPDRMILAGQSAGGVASLYAASEAPPGLVAVLAFAAGRGGDPVGSPGVPCAASDVASVFEEMGRSVRVPVLLSYAQNDLFFGPDTARAWYGRFEAGGGKAEFVLQPAFRSNGHFLFSDPAGVGLWVPEVEDFLRRHHIPFDPAKQRA
jgi:dienelactone hydrolase